MGTNYYWEPKAPCRCCERPFDHFHIGKSSGGWCFGLHVIPPEEAKWIDGLPDAGIVSLDDWKALWTRGQVVDEYGEQISRHAMLTIITERSWKSARPWSERAMNENSAVPGPNGLVRHRIGPHCIGHGDGTWDLLPGEFS